MLVVGNTGRFLKQGTPLVGSQRQGLIDQPLANDRIGSLCQPAAGQQLGHVPQTHLLSIEKILVLTAAEGPTTNLKLSVLDRQPAGRVIQGQDCLGHPSRGPLSPAGKDHVRSLLTTQRAVTLLAKNPAHGVGNVALAASVRPNDGSNPFVKFELGLGRESLVALQGQSFKSHERRAV